MLRIFILVAEKAARIDSYIIARLLLYQASREGEAEGAREGGREGEERWREGRKTTMAGEEREVI